MPRRKEETVDAACAAVRAERIQAEAAAAAEAHRVETAEQEAAQLVADAEAAVEAATAKADAAAAKLQAESEAEEEARRQAEEEAAAAAARAAETARIKFEAEVAEAARVKEAGVPTGLLENLVLNPVTVVDGRIVGNSEEDEGILIVNATLKQPKPDGIDYPLNSGQGLVIKGYQGPDRVVPLRRFKDQDRFLFLLADLTMLHGNCVPPPPLPSPSGLCGSIPRLCLAPPRWRECSLRCHAPAGQPLRYQGGGWPHNGVHHSDGHGRQLVAAAQASGIPAQKDRPRPRARARGCARNRSAFAKLSRSRRNADALAG